MYEAGDFFNYKLESEKKEFNVLDNLSINFNNYIITEGEDEETYVFLYDENTEEIEIITDEELVTEVLDKWNENNNEYSSSLPNQDYKYDEDDFENIDDEEVIEGEEDELHPIEEYGYEDEY